MIALLKGPMALSLADQVLVSAANLALSFWLIHQWAPEAFGVFAIVTSISLAGLALHQALAGSQLPLLEARAQCAEERAEALAAVFTVAFCVAAAVGLATLVGFLALTRGEGRHAALAAGLFVALHVLREHVRTYHFAQFEVARALASDLIFVLVVVCTLLPASLLLAGISNAVVFSALALGSAVAVLATGLSRRADFTLRFDRPVRERIASLWQDHARWALLGASASEMQTRGHILAVSTFFSVADLGVIQAALLLLRPVALLNTAWGKIARPVMVRYFAENHAAAAVRYADLSALGFTLATLCYVAILSLAWPFLSAHVVPRDYAGLGDAVPLWGVVTLLGLVRSVYSLQAQSVPLFRESFFASAAAMVVVGIGLILAVLWGTATSTVLALAAGELGALLVLLTFIRREVRRRIVAAAPAIGLGGAPATPAASQARQ